MANMAIDGRDGLGNAYGIPEGEWWLSVAVRLLKLGDLDGCKRFADRAMEADPLLDGIDQVIAVADVLLAGRRRIDNHVDWYGVLQLPTPSPTDPSDPAALKRLYRRLALLLHPYRTSVFGADTAYRLVSDAYSVLSDPGKKSVYDAELHIAGATATTDAVPSSEPINPIPSASPATTVSSFWTACLSCCHVHEYFREYVNRSLRCPNCRLKKKVGRPRKYLLGSGSRRKANESVEIAAPALVPMPNSRAVPTNTGVVIDNNEEVKIGFESEAHELDDYFISFSDVNASEDILGNLHNLHFPDSPAEIPGLVCYGAQM
ncbi:hypothetical protein Cni_G11498 [Canna indica]|uniref:J domain-containing protein n=1 Tax=Canna indica TaxID=4628 RepID=A0AAQ3K7Y0_9LILI|nr:hypothetical protein Cni_G11498 [Canna indica]